MGIRTYILADETGYVFMSQLHSNKEMKFTKKGINFGLIRALLTSEELEGEEGGSVSGTNYLEKCHNVRNNKIKS